MTASDLAHEAFVAALRDDDAESLYERAPCGYLSTTPDGTIVKVNQTFLTLAGLHREQVVGRRFPDLLTAGGRIYHETHYAPMLRMQGSAREIALELVRGDGRRLPVLVNSVLENDPTGAPHVIRTAVFDATQRREYERELLRAKQRAEDSEANARALSRTLQETLIPPMPPAVPGLDIAAAYRPAGEGDVVGGDFYDVFEVPGDEWMIAIGDVCGKGPEAAVVTALARYSVRAGAIRLASPAAVLESVNELLLVNRTERFCTAALLRLGRTADAWRVTVASAGHPAPVLVPAEGDPSPVRVFGSLLGVVPEPRLQDRTVDLRPGDSLLCFTDGVTEARQGSDFFGEQRLLDCTAQNRGSAERLVHGLVDEVLHFQGDQARDDIAVVALRVPVP